MMNGGMMGGNGWGSGNMMGGYGGGYLGIVGMLLQFFFWALIIVGVVFIIKWLVDQGRPTSTNSGEGSALEILKMRYARGEIDKDEYQSKRSDLLGS